MEDFVLNEGPNRKVFLHINTEERLCILGKDLINKNFLWPKDVRRMFWDEMYNAVSFVLGTHQQEGERLLQPVHSSIEVVKVDIPA